MRTAGVVPGVAAPDVAGVARASRSAGELAAHPILAAQRQDRGRSGSTAGAAQRRSDGDAGADDARSGGGGGVASSSTRCERHVWGRGFSARNRHDAAWPVRARARRAWRTSTTGLPRQARPRHEKKMSRESSVRPWAFALRNETTCGLSTPLSFFVNRRGAFERSTHDRASCEPRRVARASVGQARRGRDTPVLPTKRARGRRRSSSSAAWRNEWRVSGAHGVVRPPRALWRSKTKRFDARRARRLPLRVRAHASTRIERRGGGRIHPRRSGEEPPPREAWGEAEKARRTAGICRGEKPLQRPRRGHSRTRRTRQV